METENKNTLDKVNAVMIFIFFLATAAFIGFMIASLFNDLRGDCGPFTVSTSGRTETGDDGGPISFSSTSDIMPGNPPSESYTLREYDQLNIKIENSCGTKTVYVNAEK